MSMTTICDICQTILSTSNEPGYIKIDARPFRQRGRLIDICYPCWDNLDNFTQIKTLAKPEELPSISNKTQEP